MARFRITPRTYRHVTLAAAILLALIMVTGAAVRLTGSGLGCPEWPSCTKGSLTPRSANDYHAMVEFVNRSITGLVSLGVILAVLGSIVRDPRRRDLVWLSLGLVVGVVAQALLGALVVEKLLAPPFVMGHFLLSAVVLANAMYLHYRAGIPDGVETQAMVGSGIVTASRIVVLMASVVLVTGTVVTGAGPHSGDAGGQGAHDLKATRLDVSVPDAARVHGISVMLLLALVLLTFFLVLRARVPRRVTRRLGILLALLVAQAAVGYTQYFTGVPPFLVGVHVAGATAVFAAAFVFLLGLYEPLESRVPLPGGTVDEPARAAVAGISGST